MIIHQDSELIKERVSEGVKLFDIVSNSNKGKITLVGCEFILQGWCWKIEIYNPDKDEYWITKRDFNPSPMKAGWLDAKWFREMLINGDLRILDNWWIPK